MIPTPAHPEPHHHHHHHHHDHHHGHGLGLPEVPHASYGKLVSSFWIIAVFMGVEIFCGWLFNSLTLLSDGFHMLSDAVSLGMSALAVLWGVKKATGERTFGSKRLEILAAFANGITLVLLSLFILFQGAHRLLHPEAVNARAMLWVASLGLFVNLFVVWLLHRGGTEKTLNVEGALWHVMGDLGASVAAVAAAVAILARGWLWMDPLLSLAIAVAIAVAGLRIVRRSGHILVEGTPEGVEIEAVRQSMLADRRVRNVHDLHMWTLNGRDLYLSAHVETAPGENQEREVLAALTHTLSRDFRVDHITLQMGPCVGEDCYNKCETAPAAKAAQPPEAADKARR